jgi:hypothetical protein
MTPSPSRPSSVRLDHQTSSSSSEPFYRLVCKVLIPQHVTFLFQLKDHTLHGQFEDFNIEQEASLYPVVISLAMMIILPFFIGMTLQSQDYTIDFTLSIILCVVNVITCILGLMIAYLHLCINLVKYSLSLSSDPEEHITEDSPLPMGTEGTSSSTRLGSKQEDGTLLIKRYHSYLRNISYLYLGVFEIMVLTWAFRRSHSHICLAEDAGHYTMQGYQRAMNYFFCGSHIDIIEDNNTLAMESFYMLAIAPIMMAAIFPSLDVSWLWWQMLLSLLVYILIAIIGFGQLQPHIPSVLLLICWSTSNLFIIAQMQLDKINRFYLHLQLMDLLEENKRNAEAFHVNEMRFLIANVAHDLKTVSSFF